MYQKLNSLYKPKNLNYLKLRLYIIKVKVSNEIIIPSQPLHFWL